MYTPHHRLQYSRCMGHQSEQSSDMNEAIVPQGLIANCGGLGFRPWWCISSSTSCNEAWMPCTMYVITKEWKGEATLWRNEPACTHTDRMQSASHHYSHKCTASLHNKHSHENRLIHMLHHICGWLRACQCVHSFDGL